MAAPDQSAFEADLAGGPFLNGSLSGRWGLHALVWPHALIWVRARDERRFGFRFELTNYPQTPATAQLWDLDVNEPLPTGRWPRGSTRVPMAFNPSWNASAIYLPCDRLAIQGHENWRNQHVALLWDPSVGIARYLRVLSDLLCSGDYHAD